MRLYLAEFWNEMYGKEEFIYSTKPNRFFKEQLDKLKPRTILLPAKEEGRNAIYVASKRCEVPAFSIREQAKKKPF